MKIRYHIAGLLPALFPAVLHAQTAAPDTTLNRTVVVEQEYTPEIMDARKVNVMPEVEPLSAEKRQVEYDGTLMPARTLPAGVMRPFSAQEEATRAARGYARLGYGNRGNLDAAAAYRFDFTERNALSLDFGMSGMDGVINLPAAVGDVPLEWDAFAYSTRAALGYSHRFDALKLNTGVNFGLDNFNLTPVFDAAKQKFTKADWHIGIASTRPTQSIRYRLGTGLMYYERAVDREGEDNREAQVHIDGEVAGTISPEQQIAVGVQMDNYIYSGMALLPNHTSLTFRPRYTLERGKWHLQAGAKVDLGFNHGKSFRAAPDVRAEYRFIPSTFAYLHATGGRLANDFRRMEALSPYALVGAALQDDTYEAVNGAIGIKTSPVPNLSLHFYGGYQLLQGDLYVAGVPEEGTFYGEGDTRNAYAGGEAAYSYREIAGVKASVTYRHWDSDDADLPALTFKPELLADIRLDLRPMQGLHVAVGYGYESRMGSELESPADVSNLYARASYEFLPGFTAYVQGSNLLDESYPAYHYVPAQGINFLGGVSFRF